MKTYGNVLGWRLVVTLPDGTIGNERFHSWEAATDAFREAVKGKPKSARVYAIQRRSYGEIKTWDYEAQS